MKGLAKQIIAQAQAGETAEEYDLAGFEATSVEQLCNEVFSKPIEAPRLIKCTFIVGGGKKVRTRYNADLAQALERALSTIGFAEDRSASVSDESSMGCYKFAHDTARDLKYVHVVPWVTLQQSTDDAGEDASKQHEELSPEQQVAFASLEQFKKLVKKKVFGVSARRKLHKHLKTVQSRIEKAEQKLSNMEHLSDEERDWYENSIELDSKLQWLNEELDSMIADGQLTGAEKKEMESSFSTKKQELNQEIEKAKADNKPFEKKEKALKDLESRLERLQVTEPKNREIKGVDELVSCIKELKRLQEIENSRELKSLDAISELKKKPELEKRVNELKAANLGWFEADEGKWLDQRLQKLVQVKGDKQKENNQQQQSNSNKGGGDAKSASRKKGSGNSFAGLI